jgi:photosystem II stability/assembly factor-like uncharacterized protein
MKKLYILLFLLFSLTIHAQWQYANFPFGGTVSLLEISKSTLFCQAAGGVYTSTNNGASWQLNTAGVGARKFVMNGSDLYAVGTNIFFTADQGQNWQKLNTPTTGFTSMIISLDTIYVSTNYAMYKSIDKGTTWKAVTISLPIGTQINTMLFAGTSVLAGTSKGVYSSTDYGKSWTPPNTTGGLITTIAFLTISGTRVFAGTSSQGLFVSDDNGITWVKISGGFPPYIRCFTMIFKGTTLYVGTDNGIYSSIDNGVNWASITNGLNGFFVYALTINGADLFAGTNYTLQRSPDNGKNWIYANTGIRGLEVYNLNQNSTTIFAATTTGIFSSSNKGSSWTWCYKNLAVTSPDIYNIAIRGDTIYGSANEGVLKSTNNGLTWDTVNTGLPFPRNTFAVAVSGAYIYAASKSSMNVSTNNGGTWKRTDTTGTTVPYKLFSCLATKGSFLFAGTYNDGVFRSNDNGVSWTALRTGLPTNLYVSSLDINGTSILAGTLNGIFLSTDNGDTWNAKNTGILTNICAANFIGSDIFTGTYNTGDTYLSKNDGTTWSSIRDGLPKSSLTTFLKNGSNVFASMFGYGIWFRPLSELITGVEIENNNSAYMQVYPNPSTGIFNFRQSSKGVTVEIFNETGQRIYASEIASPQFQIDLSKEAKGIYVVHAVYKDGSFSDQKIIIQ